MAQQSKGFSIFFWLDQSFWKNCWGQSSRVSRETQSSIKRKHKDVHGDWSSLSYSIFSPFLLEDGCYLQHYGPIICSCKSKRLSRHHFQAEKMLKTEWISIFIRHFLGNILYSGRSKTFHVSSHKKTSWRYPQPKRSHNYSLLIANDVTFEYQLWRQRIL